MYLMKSDGSCPRNNVIEQRCKGNSIENTTYRASMAAEGSTVEAMCSLTVTFSNLCLLFHYSFIAQQQSCFYKELKLKLKPESGEISDICDLS
jgi:hypothetical protein